MATTVILEVIASALNLRSEPNLNGSIVGILRSGDQVVATVPGTDGWLAIASKGLSGFVAERFLRASGSTTSTIPASPPASTVDVEAKDRDLAKLHPRVREAVTAVLGGFAQAGLPFRVYEAFRTPERQEWLYQKGRTRPGGKVTKARAWQSFHQYGLAVDFVVFENGTWNWDDAGPRSSMWSQMRQAAKAQGLRTLDWEWPHVEWPVPLDDLLRGQFPPDADPSWRDNLELAVARWRRAGESGAPSIDVAERPPLAVGTQGRDSPT